MVRGDTRDDMSQHCRRVSNSNYKQQCNHLCNHPQKEISSHLRRSRSKLKAGPAIIPLLANPADKSGDHFCRKGCQSQGWLILFHVICPFMKPVFYGTATMTKCQPRWLVEEVLCTDITRGGPSGAEAAIQARPILLPMQK